MVGALHQRTPRAEQPPTRAKRLAVVAAGIVSLVILVVVLA
jgi:hypothetical protein